MSDTSYQQFEREYQRRPALFGEIPTELVLEAAKTCDAVNRTALDLGCGNGRDSLHLLKMGFQVVAVDGAPSALRSLQAAARATHQPEPHVVCADVRRLPLKSRRRFDIISMITILDHLSNSREIHDLLIWASAAIRQSGCVVVQVHTVTDPGHEPAIPDPESEFACHIASYFAHGELRHSFLDAGFRPLAYSEWRERDTDHGPVHFHEFAGGIFELDSEC
jgi:SAM-dependent methyltransferase